MLANLGNIHEEDENNLEKETSSNQVLAGSLLDAVINTTE